MEEKHTFTTFDTFSVVGLVTGVALLVFSIVSNAMTSQDAVKAQVETQRLALQILGGGLQYTNANMEPQGVRAPANVIGEDGKGRLGVDPWGQAYYVKVFTDVLGKKMVAVYSSGPDQKLETDDQKFALDAEGRVVDAEFQGDDIGTIQKSWP